MVGRAENQGRQVLYEGSMWRRNSGYLWDQTFSYFYVTYVSLSNDTVHSVSLTIILLEHFLKFKLFSVFHC